MILTIMRRFVFLMVFFVGYAAADYADVSKEDIRLQIMQEYDLMLAENTKEMQDHLFKICALFTLAGFHKGVSRTAIKEAWEKGNISYFIRRIPAGLLCVGELAVLVEAMWKRHVIKKTRDEITRAIDREFFMRDVMMSSGINNETRKDIPLVDQPSDASCNN